MDLEGELFGLFTVTETEGEDEEDEVDDWGGIDIDTVFTLSLSIFSKPFQPEGKVTSSPVKVAFYHYNNIGRGN